MKANSDSALAMLRIIEEEVPRLFSAASFQQPMDAAGIYEAYIHTLVVEAVEKLKRLMPEAGIRCELVSPPQYLNTMVLRKKACFIASATHSYSYVRIWVAGREYELHTDVRIPGRSGVLNELDILLLRAEARDAIHQKKQVAPLPSDVVLLIEAKCYGNTLELGIGRAFLGLHNSEFGQRPVGYLVSTAQNESIQKMLGYYAKGGTKFWSCLNELTARKDEFVEELARSLGEALLPGGDSAQDDEQAQVLANILELLPFWDEE